jgi:cell wall-associated NlpC family hydrolase
MAKKLHFMQVIGVPYLDRGRTLDGADCWGLACIILKEFFKIKLPALNGDYDSVEELEGVHQTYMAKKDLFDPISFDNRAPGDLIVMRVKGLPVHVGVILDQTFMIHTLPGHQSVRERYQAPTWAKRIEGVYRWAS